MIRTLAIIGLLIIAPQGSYSEISSATNGFALKLYNSFAQVYDGDFILSSYPIVNILGALFTGSSGQTQDEIRKALSLDGPNSEIVSHFKRLSTDFKKLESFKNIESRFYFGNNVTLNDDFRQGLEHNFGIRHEFSDLSSVHDMARSIKNFVLNGTCSSNCRNASQIMRITEGVLDTEASLLLVTKSSFRGSWVNKFQPQFTKPSPFFYEDHIFHSNQVKMMFQRAKFPVADIPELDSKGVSLPYRVSLTDESDTYLDSRLELIILVPNTKDGLPELETRLKHYPFSQVVRKFFSAKELFLYIPKFEVRTWVDLSSFLVENDIGKIFEEDSDFSPMINGSTESSDKIKLKLSNLFHFAEFSVDELGTKGYGQRIKSSPVRFNNPDTFRVNRPFIGFLYDQDRHVIINIFRKTS